MRRSLLLFAAVLAGALLAGCGSSHTTTTFDSGPMTSAGPSPDPIAWAGSWKSSFGAMRLDVDGATVSGTYAYCGGTLTGTVSGGTLSGTWKEDPSATSCERRGGDAPTSGAFAFTMTGGGNAFRGRWTYAGGKKDRNGDAWNGERDTGGPA
jgi:hypothetical protein